MDFATLPPEINSGLMYAGPGSGPMLAAAAAWNGLATELESAASSYGSMVSELTTGPWLGPSSASMAAAAAPYVAWMSTTAALAAQTASQAQASAAAYETAFAATVPPPVIAANRAELMLLVATNFFGQNTPAIAANQAHYAQMWAQDAAAMYSYAGSSAAASTLTPFTTPLQNTNAGGLAAQAAAVAQAGGTSAGSSVQTSLSQLTSAVPQALQSLVSSVAPYATIEDFGVSNTGLPLNSSLAGSAAGTAAVLRQDVAAFGADLKVTAGDLGLLRTDLGLIRGYFEGGALHGVGAGPAPAVSAGVGQAASIGGLSVPQAWTAAVPAMRPVAAVLPRTGAGVAPQVVTDEPGKAWAEMALAGMAGRAMMGSAASRARPTVMARPPSGG
jgi:PPE-repeat protein